ncbi:MAG: FkbM family methyltransferase [Acidimicrobiales bacterium]
MLGLKALVRPGSVCIDVGSAAGLYTVALSQLAGPEGRVHSVEPLAFAHPVWTRVLRARRSQNVTYHRMALGDEPGEAILSVPLGRYGPVTGRSFLERKSSGLGSNAEFEGQIRVVVEVDTLDGLCARVGIGRLDFVKVDVEGAELPVLEGGRDSLEALRPTLLVEIEERHTARYKYSPCDIVDWLGRRGYVMYCWDGGWRQTSSVCASCRNYLFQHPSAIH